MSPEQHARAVVALLATVDPADLGTVPASLVHALLRYCVVHHPDLARLGDYGLRRLADAIVLELGTPPAGRT